jgi:DNA-binding response OmpR family regulator
MAEVVLLRWPDEAVEAASLVTAGVAVLYLLDGDVDPPATTTCLEDWVRMPGDDRDLTARIEALRRRLAAHGQPPSVDERGRLHHRGRIVALDEREARLVRVLTQRFGDVVPDEILEAELQDDGPEIDAVRIHMTRARSRLRAADLFIRRVRRRGYVLQPATREPPRRAGPADG